MTRYFEDDKKIDRKFQEANYLMLLSDRRWSKIFDSWDFSIQFELLRYFKFEKIKSIS